jgi:hypothetical protein
MPQIVQSSTDSWQATEMATVGGGTAWVGPYHTLVIDAAGSVFKGPNASFAFGLVNGSLGVVGWSGLTPQFQF